MRGALHPKHRLRMSRLAPKHDSFGISLEQSGFTPQLQAGHRMPVISGIPAASMKKAIDPDDGTRLAARGRIGALLT